ncbi:MAG TPA: ester cyclase [Anaerolineae bacterium]|nr:ester cyclase [Anaerolineae bacterium]
MPMSVEENKAVVMRWNEEILEEGKLEAFDEVLHRDYTNHSGAESSWAPFIQGIEQAKDHFGERFQRPSRWKVSVEDIIGEGDKVVIRGVYLQEGKPVGNLIAFYRLSEGKIIDDWFCMRQLED